MARRAGKNPRKTMQRRWREGRGKGYCAYYINPFKTKDFQTIGFLTWVRGRENGGVHYLLPNLELNYLFYLEWLPAAINIHTQNSIPLDSRLKIAERLRLKHLVGFKIESKKTRAFY